jgi:nitrate/nitrite transporter NarK
MTLSFFAQGVSSTSWAAAGEMAPRNMVAIVGGITSLGANLSGIVTPPIIGWIVQSTGSYFWAINLVGGLALMGLLSYSLLLGPIYRIDLSKG